MTISRPWLAAVLALFCLPLFVGLGRGDVQDDEAIYTFAVDRILETGDWLEPKSIPNDDWAFLEKPPLKFWIVALPIRLGLLPHNEFGIRFWDALFGAAAFVYVFLIGSRLINPVAGAVAVLILFVHRPLLFYHGLRSNNMEAALLLCYCGGIYHFMVWASRRAPMTPGMSVAVTPDLNVGPTTGPMAPNLKVGPTAVSTAGVGPTFGSGATGSGAGHAVAVGLYFVLGFMTKFVAALFLPAILGAAALVVPVYRGRVFRSWKLWASVSALVLALMAPWFIWAHFTYGDFLWEMMLGTHVVTRFTSYLDPEHVQPWYFYPVEMYRELEASGTRLLVLVGLVVLTVMTMIRRSAEGVVVLLWLVVPVVAISAGTSKLYHYAYPFLPPLALAGGYLVALMLAVLPIPVARWLRGRSVPWPPRVDAFLARPIVRGAALSIAALALALAAASLIVGPIRFELPNGTEIRSSGIFRPIVVAVLFGMLGGAARSVSTAVITVLIVSLLPLPAYRRSLGWLTEHRETLMNARDCLIEVGRQVSGPGLYVDSPQNAISHPLYYYMRRVRPWTRAEVSDPARLDQYLHDPSAWRPILIWEPTYQDFWYRADLPGGPPASRSVSPSMIVLKNIGSNTFLLLPGPYAVCGEDTNAS